MFSRSGGTFGHSNMAETKLTLTPDGVIKNKVVLNGQSIECWTNQFQNHGNRCHDDGRLTVPPAAGCKI